MPTRQAAAVTVLSAAILFLAGCSVPFGSSHSGAPRATGTPPSAGAQLEHPVAPVTGKTANPRGRRYPLHSGIVATTFWVGEIFDPRSSDGSQVISTYDDHWESDYGGCDGVVTAQGCQTESRTAALEQLAIALGQIRVVLIARVLKEADHIRRLHVLDAVHAQQRGVATVALDLLRQPLELLVAIRRVG